MANFSSIKFNNVDYPLKDATARDDIAQLQETVGEAVDDIASLQTSVSGLDTRVTELEQEVSEPSYYEIVSFDALLSLVMEKGLDLPVDKPYFFPNEFNYTYLIYGDSGDIEKTILVRKQEVFVSVSGDSDYVEASFTFFAFSNGVEGRYSIMISNMGDVSVGELYTIGVNKTGVNVVNSRELHSILVSDTLYTLPDTYYLQVVPQIVSKNISDTTCYGVWVSSLDDAKNSDIAKSLYLNTMPVIVRHTVVDYEEFEHTYSIASGELYLEKVTKTITDTVSHKTFNGGYAIKFKKPKTSPEGADSYYTAQELAAEQNYIAPYLVLDGTTPKIAFEIVI